MPTRLPTCTQSGITAAGSGGSSRGCRTPVPSLCVCLCLPSQAEISLVHFVPAPPSPGHGRSVLCCFPSQNVTYSRFRLDLLPRSRFPNGTDSCYGNTSLKAQAAAGAQHLLAPWAPASCKRRALDFRAGRIAQAWVT